jgi:hypothetical protein
MKAIVSDETDREALLLARGANIETTTNVRYSQPFYSIDIFPTTPNILLLPPSVE